MPIISAQIVSGRTPEQKRMLMQGIVKATVDALNVPEQSVRVILSEVAPEHWGIGMTTKAEKDGKKG